MERVAPLPKCHVHCNVPDFPLFQVSHYSRFRIIPDFAMFQIPDFIPDFVVDFGTYPAADFSSSACSPDLDSHAVAGITPAGIPEIA